MHAEAFSDRRDTEPGEEAIRLEHSPDGEACLSPGLVAVVDLYRPGVSPEGWPRPWPNLPEANVLRMPCYWRAERPGG